MTPVSGAHDVERGLFGPVVVCDWSFFSQYKILRFLQYQYDESACIHSGGETRLLDSTKSIPVNRKTPPQSGSPGNNCGHVHKEQLSPTGKTVNGNPSPNILAKEPHKLVEVSSSSKSPFHPSFSVKTSPKNVNTACSPCPCKKKCPPPNICKRNSAAVRLDQRSKSLLGAPPSSSPPRQMIGHVIGRESSPGRGSYL